MNRTKRHVTVLLAICMLLLNIQPVLAANSELSLDECIALAVNNNPKIKIALAGKDSAWWAVKQAKAGKGFQLSLTHTAARYNSPPSAYKYLSKTIYDNELELSLPVYSGSKLESQIKQADLNYKIANLNIEATKQQLRQSVTTCYYNVLQYHNELLVAQNTADNYAKHLENVKVQYDAGIVAKSDVLASEVSLADAQNSLIKAQNNYQLAIANLNNVIGLPLDSELKLKEELRYEKFAVALDNCVKTALASRPELAEYQAKIASAKQNITIAKSGFLPAVNFVAAHEWYDKDFPGSSNGTWQVGVIATLDIFDAGLNKAKLKQAQFGLKTAVSQAEQNRDSVLLEVRQYYLGMREAEQRIATTKIAVFQAKDNLRIAELRYSAGVGTNLDVLDAVLALNQANTNDIQALFDYNTNKAQLIRAMGASIK